MTIVSIHGVDLKHKMMAKDKHWKAAKTLLLAYNESKNNPQVNEEQTLFEPAS